MQVEPQVALPKIVLARYYFPNTARFLSVDPVDDVQLRNPQSWNKFAYVRNNPLRGTDPTGKTYVDQQGKQLEQQVQQDKSRTQVEKDTVSDVSASSTAVSTEVSPDASIRVAAPGQTVGKDTVGPGELIVTGDPASVTAMGQAKVKAGQDVKIQDGQTEPGKTVGGKLQTAKITVFEGSLSLGQPATQGRTIQDRVVDTFIHESRHVFGGVYNPEALVQRDLQGTPSQ